MQLGVIIDSGPFSSRAPIPHFRMASFTFIHAADLHLGAPFRGIRGVNPEVGAALDAATYRAFERIIALAIESDAAFVLFAGDIYAAADRNLRARLRFRQGLERLHEQGIPALVIHGNHDPLDGGESVGGDLPSNTFVFPAEVGARKTVRRGGEHLAAVYGYSYPRAEMRGSLLGNYLPSEEDETLFRIGLLHGSVGASGPHANYGACTLEELCRPGIDYWALGHIHLPAVLRAAFPTVVYAGSPQGLDPGETGERGCYRVKVRDRRVTDLDFIATHSVLWYSEDISIAGIETDQDLLSELKQRLAARQAEAGCALIARLRLTGRGPLHHALQGEETRKALLAELQQVGGERFCWVDTLRVETLPQIDFDQRRRGDDLVGDFLRLCTSAREDVEVRAALRHAVRELYARGELKGVLPEVDTELDRWIARAEILGTDLLLREGGA
jgi:DNA repair protein SbcD/Mre11